MNYYLDPIGGIAGDMFIAAVAHAIPEFQKELLETLSKFLPQGVDCHFKEEVNGGICGLRFIVKIRKEKNSDGYSLNYSQVRKLLNNGVLPNGVRERALNIFQHLASAESSVHGVPIEDVHFHEVADWDSVADIIGASWIIEKLDGHGQWSCASVPLGNGRIETSHGWLPVPAPATAILLEGMTVFNDQIDGERVTPTGAAILRELKCSGNLPGDRLLIKRTGYGLGVRVFHGLPNILRFTQYETSRVTVEWDRVLNLSFNVDDQTSEEIADSLERIRSTVGVLDVIHSTAFGKKGRVIFMIEILATLENEQVLLDTIYSQTSTIGIRRQVVDRKILPRKSHTTRVGRHSSGVKVVTRPGGELSAKIESDDVVGNSLRQRREFRQEVENYILKDNCEDE